MDFISFNTKREDSKVDLPRKKLAGSVLNGRDHFEEANSVSFFI